MPYEITQCYLPPGRGDFPAFTPAIAGTRTGTGTRTGNIRPTTRDCVRLVTRGHFRSRDIDGGHAIRSAIAKNAMLHANFMALCFIEPELLPMEVLHCGNRDFLPFAPVTLTLTR